MGRFIFGRPWVIVALFGTLLLASNLVAFSTGNRIIGERIEKTVVLIDRESVPGRLYGLRYGDMILTVRHDKYLIRNTELGVSINVLLGEEFEDINGKLLGPDKVRYLSPGGPEIPDWRPNASCKGGRLSFTDMRGRTLSTSVEACIDIIRS